MHSRKQRGRSLRREARLLALVWQAARGYHVAIVVTMVLQLLVGLLPAGVTWYVQKLATGDAAGLLSVRSLTEVAVAIMATVLLRQVCSVFQGYAMAGVKRNLEHRYLAGLSAWGYADLHDGMTGRGVMAMAQETGMLTALIPTVYRSFIQAPVTVAAFLALMCWVSLRLTAVVLLLVIVVVVSATMLRQAVKRTGRSLYNRFSDLHVVFAEWLRGYKTFVFYDALPYMRARLEGVADDTCALQRRMVRLKAVQKIVVELLTYSAVIVFLIVLGENAGTTSIGTLISFPAAIIFIRGEAVSVTRGYMQLAETESETTRLAAVLCGPASAATGREWEGRVREVEFRSVRFAYPGVSVPILADVSFRLRSGSGLYVLTGESGAGKTTCIDLLAGLRRPVEGTVLYNGADTAAYTALSLARRIALVEQEPFIFEGTLRDNLTFGHSADDAVLQTFLARFRLDYLASGREGLARLVGSGGRDLSTGEKARIGFIRALLKQPDVILLDEVTAGVDAETSHIMLEAAVAEAARAIVLLITHDPAAAARGAHRLELKHGRIAAESLGL